MLYDDRFAGHLDMDDPRGPLSAAAGCVWPTIPPHRFLLYSDNATGTFGFINGVGILMERASALPAHDFCSWSAIALPPWLYTVALQKDRPADGVGFRYYFTWRTLGGCVAEKLEVFPEKKCNFDWEIGNCIGDPCGAQTGSSFKAYQVEFDKTWPPDLPPPP